jgi:hypothetical protein
MKTNCTYYDLNQSQEKPRFILNDISQVLFDTFKIKRKIKKLNKLYSENLAKVGIISNEIRAEAVTVIKNFYFILN